MCVCVCACTTCYHVKVLFQLSDPSRIFLSFDSFWSPKFLLITDDSGENLKIHLSGLFPPQKNYPEEAMVYNKDLYSTCFYLGQNAASFLLKFRKDKKIF